MTEENMPPPDTLNDDEKKLWGDLEGMIQKSFQAMTKPAEEECWMQTLTGGVFFPLKPRLEDINIHDIAGSLSKLCRFGGHCNKFYSVAEHSVLVARCVPYQRHRLAALLHDASEAYLVDIPRPLKPWLTGYKEIEQNLEKVIAERFGFDYPLHSMVKEIDMAILSDERRQTMARMDVEPRLWGNVYPPLGIRLQFWSPPEAEFEFISMFHKLYRERSDAGA